MTSSNIATRNARRLRGNFERPLRVALILGTDAETQSQLMSGSGQSGSHPRAQQGHPMLAALGNCDVGNVLNIVDRSTIEFYNLGITRNYLKQPERYNLDDFDVLFNVISDPEINPKSLNIVGRLMKQTRRPWINDPRQVLKTMRDVVAQRLASVEGMYVPKTAKISSFTRQSISKALQDLDLDFPVLVRKAGTHTGQTLQLLTRIDDILEDNEEKGNWYVIEFVDFKSPDGLYRKYRAFVIGEKVIIAHVMPAGIWNVHGAEMDVLLKSNSDLTSTGYYEMLTNRISQIKSHKEIIINVKNILKLDYFGIDFALYKDSILLFEANAAMNQFPMARYAAKVTIGDTISALIDLICQKGFGVKPDNRLQNLSPPLPSSGQFRESEIVEKSIVLPDLPIKVAVLTGADKESNWKSGQDERNYIKFPEYRVIFQKLGNYIDINLIKFQVYDINDKTAEISLRFINSNSDIAFNLTSDPDCNPQTFEKLSELKKETDLKWINDPDSIGSVADAMSSHFSNDSGTLIRLANDPSIDGIETTVDYKSTDGLYRKYRLLFVGPEASVVDFFVNRDPLGDAASSAELIRNDPALGQEERDALIGNRPFDDEQLLKSLRELRGAIKADTFGVDCAQLPNGRLLILRLDPSMLHLPLRKYQGLPTWRPASALSRLIHQRATGLA